MASRDAERAQSGCSLWWIFANTLGFAIALAVVMNSLLILDRVSIATPISNGVAFGIADGMLPWLVLPRQAARAGWWGHLTSLDSM